MITHTLLQTPTLDRSRTKTKKHPEYFDKDENSSVQTVWSISLDIQLHICLVENSP